jgi:hypothetical protein
VIRSRSTALAARAGSAAVALAATLLAAALLSACGSTEPGAAAVVGDRRISVADVQSATTDIAAAFPGQDVAPQQVLFFLISGPYIVDAAAKVNAGVSASEARAAMKAAITQNAKAAPNPSPSGAGAAQPTAAAVQPVEPSDAGVVVYQANTAISNINRLDQATQKTAVDGIKAALAAAHIQVSPRYGTFDSTKLTIVPARQNWMSSPSPSAAAVPADQGGDPSAPADGGQTPAPAAS